MIAGRWSFCVALVSSLSLSSSAESPQLPSGTGYIPTDAPDEVAAASTPDFARALVARIQTGGIGKLEAFLRDDGFSSGGTPLCFGGRADCYRNMDGCADYSIRFNHQSSIRFRPELGVNGAFQVDLAIKRRDDSSAPFDLENIDIHLRNPTSVFSWCFINPVRDFHNGRLKFTENGTTPGLEVQLIVEPFIQGGQLAIRRIGGAGVRINRMYLHAPGWPDFVINFVFNLGFIRSAIAGMIERETMTLVNNYLRELLRFQGGYEGFSYGFYPSRDQVDSNGLSLGFNGGINYLQTEDACTAGRAPWPDDPGTNPVSTIESYYSQSDVGVGVRTVLANNALREAYNRGTFCYSNDTAPFRLGDFCGLVPQLCEFFPPQLDVLVAAKLWPPDPANPNFLPRVEIAQEGPDGSLLARFSGLNIQMVLRDPDSGKRLNLACLNLDAAVEAKVNFSGSAVFVKLGSERTRIDAYRGSLLPTDIVACTGGVDFMLLFPPDAVERLIRETLIPYFNNSVGQVPFSANVFRFGCYRVFANGLGLGGEYANIYASLLKVATLPSCGDPGGRTTLEVFTGPAEGSITNNSRPRFEARAADPRGEAACVDFRYASGFDSSPGAYLPAGGCPLGIYGAAPDQDLADGPHVFRMQAKTLPMAGEPICLPAGRPECASDVIERHFTVDTQPPEPPRIDCRDIGTGLRNVQWASAADGMTKKEELRYLWFIEDALDGGRQQSINLLTDANRFVSIGKEFGAGARRALRPNGTYAFYVKAVDLAGNVSAESNRCIFTSDP